MKSIKKSIPACIAHCLWSYDLSSIDAKRDRDLIITQVLNYGDWKGLKWLFQTYPEREIKNIIAHPRRGLWFKQVLNFWCLMLNIKLPAEVRERAIFRLGPGKKK